MKIVLEIETTDEKSVQEAGRIVSVLMACDKIGTTKAVAVEARTKDSDKATQETTEKPKKEKTTTTKANKEKAVEEKSEPVEEESTSSITLDVLKKAAQDATIRSDRALVKAAIAKFAPKLADVDEAHYGKVYKALQILGKE